MNNNENLTISALSLKKNELENEVIRLEAQLELMTELYNKLLRGLCKKDNFDWDD